MIAFSCAHCDKALRVKDELAGKRAKCPACGKPITVPNPSENLVTAAADAGTHSPVPDSQSAIDAERTLPPKEPSTEVRSPSLASSGDAQSVNFSGGDTDGGAKANDGHPAELTNFLAPPQAADEIGRLGTYRVQAILGRGGMGVVFRAQDPHLERLVALKAMLPSLATSPAAKERFFREAKAAAALKHPHIVTIFQVGEDRGAPFLAMEFLEGESLDDRVKREVRVPVPEILRIGKEMANGLAAAHAKGLIHRDIKPGNIWLEGNEGHVKILDFGLARAVAEQTSLTQSGAIIGTPAYMAPEQACGKKVDHRCDLFSLGCVLYRMCTGELPFTGPDTIAIIAALALETPQAPRELNPHVPQALSELVMQLLAKNPEERPKSAKIVADALSAMEKPTTSGVPEVVYVPAATVVDDPFANIDDSGYESPALNKAGARRNSKEKTSAIPASHARTSGDDSPPSAHAPVSLKKSRSRPLLFAGLAGVLVIIATFVFIKIMNKDGATAETKGTDGAKIEVVDKGKPAPPPSEKKTEALPAQFKNSIGMEFVLVPKGKSWLGGGDGQPGGKRVEFTEDFFMGKYEVTQDEWRKVMGNNPSYFSRNGGGKAEVIDVTDAELGRFPVETLSWDEAQLFIKKLNALEKQVGWEYRLPKSEEWEYACRGGPLDNQLESSFNFYFEKPTNQLLPEQANFRDSGLKRTCKVGSYPPNRLGLHDMHGNLMEFCDDVFDYGPKSAPQPFIRGGGLTHEVGKCRANYRGWLPTLHRYFDLGLRVARVPIGKEVGAEAKDAPPSRDPDRRAAEYVLSIGGVARVDGQDRDIKEINQLPKGEFRLTYAGGNKLTDAGLANFKNCKNLTSIELTSSPVTDEGLPYFKDCKNLLRLSLSGTRVTDAGMASFQGCDNLISLNLHFTQVGDAGIACFKSCKKLEDLWIHQTRITDIGLANFKDCKKLKTLNLANLPMTDEGFASFKDCKDLTQIGASNTKVGDAAMAQLKECQNVRALQVSGTQVTDAGLAHLAALKNLVDLHAASTKVTAKGIADLAKALPKCRIQWDGGTIEPKKADSATDLDRRAAEYVLSLGDTVSVNDEQRLLRAVADLPREPFRLTSVILRSDKLSAMGLAAFKNCKNLVQLNAEYTRVGDTELPYFKDCKNLEALILGGPLVSDAGLANFKECKNLKQLGLAQTQVTDAGLAYFKDCKNLGALNLSGTHVTDAGLAYFKDCMKLSTVMLNETEITDNGLAQFRDSQSLINLQLNATRHVTDAGLAHFKNCKALMQLYLNDTGVSDAGLINFKDCTNLGQLGLQRTKVTDAGLANFKDCKQLGALELNGTQTGDAGLAHFKECKLLSELRLEGTKITDASLELLAGFKKLASLMVKNTKMTEAGVKKLAVALPGCRISWDGGDITK